MKMFEVIAKCGHVGKNKYILKSFAVKAEDGKQAAKLVRGLPRVKHHHKDAIKSVEEVCYERYLAIKVQNDSDPYFKCKNVQEQRHYEMGEIYYESQSNFFDNEEIKKPVYFKKTLIRNTKKYFKNYDYSRYAI